VQTEVSFVLSGTYSLITNKMLLTSLYKKLSEYFTHSYQKEDTCVADYVDPQNDGFRLNLD
jgi:hypothetical protein